MTSQVADEAVRAVRVRHTVPATPGGREARFFILITNLLQSVDRRAVFIRHAIDGRAEPEPGKLRASTLWEIAKQASRALVIPRIWVAGFAKGTLSAWFAGATRVS